MTASSLADRLIAGGDSATAAELLDLLRHAPREELHEAAHHVTMAFAPKCFDFCGIVNARSGRCPENCKWCAQSAHWKTGCEVHGWIGTEACVKAAADAEANGVGRIGIVTSGRAQTPADIAALCDALRAMKARTRIHLCGSLGLLSEDDLSLANPHTPLRFAGGRTQLSDDDARRAIFCGITSGIAGPLLTTPGANYADDRALAAEAGYEVAQLLR